MPKWSDVARKAEDRGWRSSPLASVLWSVLHGLAMLIIENQMRPYAGGPEGTEHVTRYTIEVLYEGLPANKFLYFAPGQQALLDGLLTGSNGRRNELHRGIDFTNCALPSPHGNVFAVTRRSVSCWSL